MFSSNFAEKVIAFQKNNYIYFKFNQPQYVQKYFITQPLNLFNVGYIALPV
jgi:hypothetical protein